MDETGERVYLTSCETTPGAWRHQEELLLRLWACSGKKHSLVDRPENATLILVGNLRDEDWGERLLKNPVISRFPNRCFAIADGDDPMVFLHGLYTSGSRSRWFPARVRSGSYGLYHPDFQNPVIAARPGLGLTETKLFLFTFSGRNCSSLRNEILKLTFSRPDIAVADTSTFNLFVHDNTGKLSRQQEFADRLAQSKFALCPRGNGTASIRLFEAMQLGVAPVIISDDWIPPAGPAWGEFSIRVKESEIAQLEAIVAAHESNHYEMGRRAHAAYEQFFSEPRYFDYIVENCIAIRNKQWIPESVFWRGRRLVQALYKARGAWRRRQHRAS